MNILYEIFVINGSDPANVDYQPPSVTLKYIGGATGTPKGRIYKVGDAAPAFVAIAPTALKVAATAGQNYIVEFSDNVTPSKQLAIAEVKTWAAGCYADLALQGFWISVYRFSGKVQVTWFGSPPLSASIDGGVTYKNLINTGGGFGASAEWSNAELDLLGYTVLIPNIKTKRVYLTNQQNVNSFGDPFNGAWPPTMFTKVNVSNTAGFTVGTVVKFSANPKYSSGSIVEVGSGYFIIQSTYTGDVASLVKVGYETTCVNNIASSFFIGDLAVAPFTATETHSDVTTEGGSDGTINVAVLGGSGSFSYVWSDLLINSPVRSGLPANEYDVIITDTVTGQELTLIIFITQPSPSPAVDGTFLDIPFMNCLQWVDKTEANDFINNPQALDNRLLCEQEFDGFDKTNYFQKVCSSDVRLLQFYSDYSNFLIELFDYATMAKVKEFGFIIKEQNIGIPEDFSISIRNHIDNPGQSRIYFATGPIPIPVKIGDAFTIFNNLDGFNGSYAVVNIINDFTLGYQYLVINKNYAIPATSSSASARFFTTSVDFNVFESAMSFADVAAGQYYATLKPLNLASLPTSIVWVSEPIEIAATHKKTNVLEYRNKDNAFGITWTTGYIGQVRIESELFKRIPGGERSTNRNADFSLTKINAKKQRIVLFETHYLPPYLHEKLSVAFDCDAWSINKIAFQSSEAYSEPQYIDAFMLANASIKIEQQHWFDGYNSDDLGTVNEGGFLVTEKGFIKR